MKTFSSLVWPLISVCLMLTISNQPTHAQATRTWVSGVGDDVNPCSRTAPCKTFAGAISKTAINGVINCLDSGGFGSLTITKSVSIVCNGAIGGVLASGVNGLVISTPPGGKVTLEGLDIDGAGTGLDGVRIVGGAKVFINKSTIRNFTGDGIDMVGPDGTRLVLQDSTIIGNNGGISIGGAGVGNNRALLIRTIIENNAAHTTRVTAPSSLFLSGSILFGGTGISNVGNAVITSTGNNIIGSGAPTETIPFR